MGLDVEAGWPCAGPLLRMAKDVANRLLPAFDTPTGMPYGTVNLREGVPEGETPITCTAGVGTYIIEFGTLSRLTADPVYEQVALRALHSVWQHRSSLNLLGNHIDVLTGRWTAQDSGIGAGVDSYFEYLAKAASLLRRPELMKIFHDARAAVEKHLRHDDWHLWATMTKGYVTMAVFQSLEAYWPGVLTIVGDINSAQRIVYNYHQVWKQFGFTPEFYNIPQSEAPAGREGYPLRPELVESLMYLYQATSDPAILEMGADILASINHSAKTQCGYATIKSVTDHTLENRMESFFLAETTKYLYLLFDPDNWIHNTGRTGTMVKVGNRQCVVEAGGYIFNSEAHPVDPGALACCSTKDEDWTLSVKDQVALILDPTKLPWTGRKGQKKAARTQKPAQGTNEEAECGEEAKETGKEEERGVVNEEQKPESKVVILKGNGKVFTISESPADKSKKIVTEKTSEVTNQEGEQDATVNEVVENKHEARFERLIEESMKDLARLREEKNEAFRKNQAENKDPTEQKEASDAAELDILKRIREKVKDRILDEGRHDNIITGSEGGRVGSEIMKDGPRFASLSEAAERGQGGNNNSGMESTGSAPSVSSSKYGTSSGNQENRTPTTTPRITPSAPVLKRVFSLSELKLRLAMDLQGYKNLTTTASHSLLSCTQPPFTHMFNYKGQMFNP